MSIRGRASDERPKKSDTPILLRYRSSNWFIVATICVASFSVSGAEKDDDLLSMFASLSDLLQDAFIYGVIVPVLPLALRARSGVSEDDVTFWNSMLLAAFGAAQFIGSPFFGWLADQTSSRRTPLLMGFVCNAVATALLCFAKSIWVLLISRFLQGLSAAIVYTVGFALLVDTVGSKDIGQWMGYVIACLNVGMALSPSIGGLLYAKAGYMSLFVAMFGLIALDILLRLVMVEKKVAIKWAEPLLFEPPRQAGGYGTLPSSVDRAVCERPKAGSGNTEALFNPDDESHQPAKSLVGPRIANSCDQTVSSQNIRQIPPLLTLLTSPRVLINLYGVSVSVTLLTSFDSALPIFVGRTFDWGSTGGGLVFLPVTVPILAAPLAGKLADVMDSRWVSASGFILAALFTALLLLIRHGSIEQVLLLFVLLALYGAAQVVGSTPLGANLAREVERTASERPGIFGKSGAYAQVFALYTSASAAGVLVGPAWTSFAYGDRGWTFLVISLGVLSASVAVPLLLFVKPQKKDKDRDEEDSAEV